MASIERYSTGAGVRYSVRYRTPSGSQTKTRGFKTKRDTELFLANTEVRKATGDYVAPKLGRTTVGDLGAEWLERKRPTIKQITYINYEHIWRRQVLPRWGSVPIASVDVSASRRGSPSCYARATARASYARRPASSAWFSATRRRASGSRPIR
jgi:Phage integrase, N-terminal SAM-like domain